MTTPEEFFADEGVQLSDVQDSALSISPTSTSDIDLFFENEGVEVVPPKSRDVSELERGELSDIIIDDIVRGVNLTGKRAFEGVEGVSESLLFMGSGMGSFALAGYASMGNVAGIKDSPAQKIAEDAAGAPRSSFASDEDFQNAVIQNLTFRPQTPVGKAVESAFHWLGEEVIVPFGKWAGDHTHDISNAIGLPEEASAALGAGVTASAEVFAAPMVAKGVTLPAQAVSKAKTLNPAKMFRQHRKNMDAKLKQQTLDNLIDNLSEIEGIEARLQKAVTTEQTIPGYKSDLAEATRSPLSQERKQSLIDKSESARSRAQLLRESNKNATEAFVQRVFGEPNASVSRLVEASNGKMQPVIDGLLNELKVLETETAKIRTRMETRSTPELGADMLNSIQRRYKMEHAVENALWEVIGDAPIEFRGIHQTARAIEANRSLWKDDFPEIVDRVIQRFGKLESDKAKAIQQKQVEIQQLQKQRAVATTTQLGQKGTSTDLQLTRAQQELQQIAQQPIDTAISLREGIEFKKAVNTAWNIENRGLMTKPNAARKASLLGDLIGEFEGSIGNLSKSVNKRVVQQYDIARGYSKRLIENYKKGPIGDMRQPGDVLNEVRMSVEAIADRAFKKAAGNKGGVQEFQKVLDVLPSTGQGFTVLKEIVVQKFAKDVLNEAGEIVPKKVDTFFNKYGDMLDLVKPWKNELSELGTATEVIQWMRENTIARKNMTENMFLNKLIRPAEGETSASAFERIVMKPGALKALTKEAASMGVPKSAVSRAVGSMILKHSRSVTADGSFSINTGKALEFLRENNKIIKESLTEKHFKELEAIYESETGHNLFKTIFRPDPGRSPTIIGKVEEFFDKSARSFGTDIRAKTQGRTSSREIVMSTMINTYGRMNHTQVNAIMELALFDTSISEILASIIKKREAGKAVPRGQIAKLNKRLLETGQLRRVMSTSAQNKATGLPALIEEEE